MFTAECLPLTEEKPLKHIWNIPFWGRITVLESNFYPFPGFDRSKGTPTLTPTPPTPNLGITLIDGSTRCEGLEKACGGKIQCVRGEIGHQLTHSLTALTVCCLWLCVCVWVWLTASSPALHFTSVAHTHTLAQQIGLKRISLLSLCYFGPVSVFFAQSRKKKASVFNEFVPKALIHTYAVHTHTSAVYIYTNSVFIWIWTAVGMDSSSSLMSLIAVVKCSSGQGWKRWLKAQAIVDSHSRPCWAYCLWVIQSSAESQPKTSKEARPDFAKTPVASDKHFLTSRSQQTPKPAWQVLRRPHPPQPVTKHAHG